MYSKAIRSATHLYSGGTFQNSSPRSLWLAKDYRYGINTAIANLLLIEGARQVNHPTSATILVGAKHLGDKKALSQQSEFIKLKHLLADILVCRREAEQTELFRVTSLTNALNEKGFTDDEIRREFAEALENGQFYS